MTITRRDALVGTASAALVGTIGASGLARAAEGADLIITGGPIVTMAPAQPSADAVAVKDGRIVAVGSREAVEAAWKGPATRLVDLAGKALVPGFIDAHGHFMNAPRAVASLPTMARPPKSVAGAARAG